MVSDQDEPIAYVDEPPNPSAQHGIARLNLEELDGEIDAEVGSKTEDKDSKSKKKVRPETDENNEFVLLTPRENEDEQQGFLSGFFSALRREYKIEVLTSPRNSPKNSSYVDGIFNEEEVINKKDRFSTLKRLKRKAGMHIRFAQRVSRKEIKLRAEQVVSRDMSDSMPEIKQPEKELLPLHHGSPLPRRVTTVVAGSIIAIAGYNGNVSLFDGANGGKPTKELCVHPTEVYDISWLGDDLIGTVGNDGFLRTWSVESGEQVDNIEIVGRYGTAMVSLDTENVLVGTVEGDLIRFGHKCGKNLKQMASKTNVHDNSEEIHHLKDFNPGPGIETLSIVPDDEQDYSTFRPEVKGRDSERQQNNIVLGERRIWKMARFGNDVVSVSEDRTCVLTNARNFQCYGKWRHRHPVLSVAINSRYIVTGSMDTMRIRKREEDLLRVRVWKGMHDGSWVHSLILYKTDILISAGGDGNVVLYNLLTDQPIHRIGTGFNAVWDITLLRGGRLAMCGPWAKEGYILDLKEFDEAEGEEDQAGFWKIWSPRSAQRSPSSDAPEASAFSET